MRKPKKPAPTSASLRRDFGSLYDALSAALNRHDPLGLITESNMDEYDIEVDTILPRLRTCTNAAEVTRVVHEEFVRWFDRSTAGPRERYTACGAEVWELWSAHLSRAQAKPVPPTRP